MATDNTSDFGSDLGPSEQSLLECDWFSPNECGVYQLGCFALVNGFFVPPNVGTAQIVWLRSCLTIGTFLHVLWAAPCKCWPDAFGWNLACFILNAAHLIYVIYQIYPVEFDLDVEKIYDNLFQPFGISKQKFRTLIDRHGAMYELDATGRYALERSTPTGTQLSLLVSGRMRVEAQGTFLHHINPGHFMDSPEWLASMKHERSTLFQVTLTAETCCRYIQWEKSSLESFLRREPFIRAVFESYIGKDIANKLYAINESIDNPPPPASPRKNVPFHKQGQPILEPLTLENEDVGLLSHKWERVNSDDDASSPPASPGLLMASGSWQSVNSDRSMVDIRASLASGRGADVSGLRAPKANGHPMDSPPESPCFLVPPGFAPVGNVTSV